MNIAISLLIALMLGIAIPAQSMAQEDSTDVFERSGDVLDDMLDDFDVEDSDTTNNDTRRKLFRSKRSPRIGGLYGQATFTRAGLSDMTHGLTMFGGSIGMEQYRSLLTDRDIIRVKNDGLFVQIGQHGTMPTLQASFDDVPLAAHTSIDVIVFGLINESGYGYAIGENSSVRFLVSEHSTWTSVKPQTYAVGDTAGWQQIRDFTGTFRYGSTMAPTIEWKMGSFLSIRGGYQWTQVLPRHMFWYWAGSAIIEGVADGLAGAIVKSFGRASVRSLPVINFIVRNAVAYGFKELRRDKMNWPFDTVAPLNITSWNVGLSLTF